MAIVQTSLPVFYCHSIMRSTTEESVRRLLPFNTGQYILEMAHFNKSQLVGVLMKNIVRCHFFI